MKTMENSVRTYLRTAVSLTAITASLLTAGGLLAGSASADDAPPGGVSVGGSSFGAGGLVSVQVTSPGSGGGGGGGSPAQPTGNGGGGGGGSTQSTGNGGGGGGGGASSSSGGGGGGSTQSTGNGGGGGGGGASSSSGGGGGGGSSSSSSVPYVEPTSVSVGPLQYAVGALAQALGAGSNQGALGFAGAANQALCNLGTVSACPAPAAAGPAPAPAAAAGGPPAPPPPPPVPPAAVAQMAVSQMALKAIEIGIVPKNAPGSVGLVGLPVYMWTADPGPHTTGPISTTAAAGATVVTATGTLDRVAWTMGDGNTVVCAGSNAVGTPYQTGFGADMSPNCGYRYDRSSEGQPGNAWHVTATSYWTVNWAGGGQAGTIPMQFNTATGIQVGEMQVLISH